MINERMIELSLLLAITEKLPYNKEERKFIYNDKVYSEERISNRIYELVTEFMKDYEEPYVTNTAEKSE